MKKIWTVFLLLLFSVPGLAYSEEQAQGGLKDVVIKGGQRSGVQSEKPPLKMEVDIDEPVFSLMMIEKDLLQRRPETMRNPSAGFSPFINNENIILPARVRISRNPVKTFYPLRSILANFPAQFQEIGTGWEMTVTDSDGRSFKKFSGEGLPPSTLDWDGRGDNGQIAAVGRTYSTVISYRDTRAQTRTFVGDPFMFDGLLHQEREGLFITLSLDAIFQSNKKNGFADEELSSSGQDLLKEAADWIKRFYFNYPLTLKYYDNDSQSSEKAQRLAKLINKYLILAQQTIEQSVSPIDAQGRRVDIIIGNR